MRKEIIRRTRVERMTLIYQHLNFHPLLVPQISFRKVTNWDKVALDQCTRAYYEMGQRLQLRGFL